MGIYLLPDRLDGQSQEFLGCIVDRHDDGDLWRILPSGDLLMDGLSVRVAERIVATYPGLVVLFSVG